MNSKRLARAVNIADLRELARKRLPRAIFDYLDGGAGDEISLRANTAAFERHHLVPRALIDVGAIDMSCRVLGCEADWPVMLAPTGMSRLFHDDGEAAAARAAARAGSLYALSTVATQDIEEVAAGAPKGPKVFQIYMFRDRGVISELIERARAAGYQALMLTVDVPVAGNRERDSRNGMTLPPRITARTLVDGMTHPSWSWGYLTGAPFSLANVADRAGSDGNDLATLAKYVARQFDPSVTWDDAAQLIAQWNGPFAIKGILSPLDAIRAASIGASAVVVSNHGGRQLDGAPAPIDVVSDIADAAGDSLEIILDSGIRRAAHVLKALARGADACMIGRPYLYGLGAGGEAGVDRALEILKTEMARDLAILGCPSIKDLDRSFIGGVSG